MHNKVESTILLCLKINQLKVSSHGKSLTQLSSTYAVVMDQVPSPSWQGALNSHESETKLHPAIEAHKSELLKMDECAFNRDFQKSQTYRA